MSMQETTSTNQLQKLSAKSEKGQYTLWQILGIWLAGGAASLSILSLMGIGLAMIGVSPTMYITAAATLSPLARAGME